MLRKSILHEDKRQKDDSYILFDLSLLPESLPYPQTLQEVKLQVVGNKECACKFETILAGVIQPTMICAGGKVGKAVCQVRQLFTKL